MNAFHRFVTGALLCAAATFALADDLHGPHYPDVVSSARGIETSSAYVLLPSSVPGSMTVNHCTNCKSTTLSVTDKTTFFVGSRQVPFAEFRGRLAGLTPTFMMVYAAVNGPVALSIVLSAPPIRSR